MEKNVFLAQRLNSLFLMMSNGLQIKNIHFLVLIQRKELTILVQKWKAEILVIDLKIKEVTFRCRLLILQQILEQKWRF